MHLLAIINSYKQIDDIVTENLKRIISQKLYSDTHIDIVVSDTMSDFSYIDKIKEYMHNFAPKNNIHIYIVFFNEHYPVYITFNSTIKIFNEFHKILHINLYDYYIYISEDCLMTSENDLQNLMQEFNENDVGQVTGLVDWDNSLLYPHYNIHDANAEGFQIRIGESINMHFSIWSKYFMEKYNFKYPDILIAYATESFLTFLNAAIGTKWVHCRRVILNHVGGPRRQKEKGTVGWETYKNFRSIKDIFSDGVQYGIGFECHDESQFPYNKDCYNEIGECLYSNDLYNYIVNNLFLPENVLNYKKVISNVYTFSNYHVYDNLLKCCIHNISKE